MSFSATVGTVERTASGVVHSAFKQLHDVSVVTMPAYLGTSVVARKASPQSLRGQLAVLRHNARKGK
jgi:phage head maturation protease